MDIENLKKQIQEAFDKDRGDKKGGKNDQRIVRPINERI